MKNINGTTLPKIWIILAAVLAASIPGIPNVSAVEVSLEENRAERGNIGYIDMQKLFKLFPETAKAKQNFEDILRQAEDQVNLKKQEQAPALHIPKYNSHYG